MPAIPIPQPTPIERAGWSTDYQGAPAAVANAVGNVVNPIAQANDIASQQAQNNMRTAQAASGVQDLQDKQRSMQLSMLSGILNEPDPDKQRDLIGKLIPLANKINPSMQIDSSVGVPEIRALVQSQKPIENLPPTSFLQSPGGQSLSPIVKAGLQSGQLNLKDVMSAQAANPFLNIGGSGISNLPTGESANGGSPTAGTMNAAPTYESGIQQLPSNMQPTVRAIIEGRESPPNPNSRAPSAQALMQAVNAVDPDFDFTNAGKRQATAKSFASGSDAASTTSLNTLAGHLGNLQTAWSGLNNEGSSWNPFRTALNSAENTYTGSTGSSGALNSFNISKSAVSDELSKLLKGGVVSDSEKKEWESNINNGASPEQQKAALSEIGGIIESRLDALNNKYHEGMGPVNASKNWATPQSQAVFDQLQGRTPQNATTQAQARLKQPDQSNQPQTPIKTPDDVGAALQSGKITEQQARQLWSGMGLK